MYNTPIYEALAEAFAAEGRRYAFHHGSFLMHVQELEMVARHRLKLLFCGAASPPTTA
jgi:thiamine pyrophosphate-dependent acetolactate synthase large subunit-like protein